MDKWIIFQSYDRIYYFDKESEEITFTTDLNNYYRIYKVDNKIYLQKRDGNIYSISNGGEQLFASIPKNYNIKIITGIYKEKDDLILVTRDQGFFLVHNRLTTKLPKFNLPEFDNKKIFSSVRLSDGNFAVGTISHGVFHLSAAGEVLSHIDQSAGLGNNTVLGLYEDVDGNVWAALDNGISCINMKSYIRDYNEINGTIGTVYASITYDDYLYVGSNQGLFYKRKDHNEKLTQIKGMEGQVWSLSIHQGDLLCGHTRGTFKIKGNTFSVITSIPGTWKISDIPGSAMALQGHYEGMSTIMKKSGEWKLYSRLDLFENSARFFEILNKHEIWVNHEYKGVYRIEVNDTWTDIISSELQDYIPRGEGSSIFALKDTLYYAYRKGVYKIVSKLKKMIKDPIYSSLIDSNLYVSGRVIPDHQGRIWTFNQYMINYAKQGPVKSQFVIKHIPIHNNWRKTTASFENITNINEDTYLVGKYNGYFLIDLQKYKPIDHKINITKISMGSGDKPENNLISLNNTKDIRINYKDHNITLNYSVPVYDKYSYTLYQYKLSGIQNEWSRWEYQPNHTFEKLPFGDYTFEVRSKIGNRLSNNTDSYQFTILPPYYLSTAALILYTFGGILILYLAQRWNSRSLRRQNRKLVQENQRKVEMMKLQNEQELSQLKNDLGRKFYKHGVKEYPLEHGYDYFLGFSAHAHDYFHNSDSIKALTPDPYGTSALLGPLMYNDGFKSYKNGYLTEIFTDEAIKIIEEKRAKPFFLTLSYNAVHHLIHEVPQRYLDMYDVPKIPNYDPAQMMEYGNHEPGSYSAYYDKYSRLGPSTKVTCVSIIWPIYIVWMTM